MRFKQYITETSSKNNATLVGVQVRTTGSKRIVITDDDADHVWTGYFDCRGLYRVIGRFS